MSFPYGCAKDTAALRLVQESRTLTAHQNLRFKPTGLNPSSKLGVTCNLRFPSPIHLEALKFDIFATKEGPKGISFVAFCDHVHGWLHGWHGLTLLAFFRDRHRHLSDGHSGTGQCILDHLGSSWYPLVNIEKTMENHHFLWENPL